ncbi:MAG: MATE family efflux transporter [Firmicutes bacterium]|nr:MATE family efflux transporter [Bacillota bacterium]
MEIYKKNVLYKFADIIKNKNISKNLFNSFYYFGGTFLSFLIAIFTQPIFSRYLELEDFAVIGYFGAIQAIIYPLFSMSLPFYYMARYWNKETGEEGHKNLSFIMNFLNISNSIIALIAYVALRFYFHLAEVVFPLMPFILIVLMNLFFEKFKTFYLLECRVHKQGLRFFLINVLQIVLNTGFSLYFVVTLQGGAVGKMSGALVGVIIVGVLSLGILIRQKKYNFSLHIEKKKIISALKYCIPLIIGAYAYYPIGNIDKLFLERLGNVSEYGYYSIGLTISGFVSAFFLALYQSFEPDLYRLIAQKKHRQYKKYVRLYIVVIAVISVLFILISEPIVAFLTAGRYTYASTYANIFVIGIFFMQVGGIYEQLFTAYGATKLVMWRNIMMGVFCIVVYYLMIHYFQFKGANITRVFSALFYILSGTLLWIYYKRKQLKAEA